jgi:hypothetical protein
VNMPSTFFLSLTASFQMESLLAATESITIFGLGFGGTGFFTCAKEELVRAAQRIMHSSKSFGSIVSGFDEK